MKTQFVRLKPGYNGNFLPVFERNWGSYVAYILESDLYREVLASENYFDLRSDLINKPTTASASYKGNVVIQSPTSIEAASPPLIRKRNMQSRKSAFPRMEK